MNSKNFQRFLSCLLGVGLSFWFTGTAMALSTPAASAVGYEIYNFVANNIFQGVGGFLVGLYGIGKGLVTAHGGNYWGAVGAGGLTAGYIAAPNMLNGLGLLV